MAANESPQSPTPSNSSLATCSSFDGVPAVDPVGLSHPDINHGIRQKLDAMNKLHSTGVQVDIDLPQIAVIGNQSAGKSSLIESISGITLPRAAGTCTRCPTECRLARSEGKWQCVVSLRYTVDSKGQPLGQARTERFGETIFVKSDVEERIRRAQFAILNSDDLKKLDHFLTAPEEALQVPGSQQSFSANCITLQISGPDVADLSFCDLPGLIASASSSRGGDNSIDLVRDLVVSYIKKPSCIILLTVACETDFENQGAHRLAKLYDPAGRRTIGVLTKPDRIPQGEEENWLPYIRNDKEPLENNWFCVRQPSSSELKKNRTWDEYRDIEREFFSTESPWCDLDDMYTKFLGTNNIVHQLSAVLSDLIGLRMPQIQEELESSILKTKQLLSALPPPPSNDARTEILTLLHGFATELGQQVRGVPDAFRADANSSRGLIQSMRPLQDKFRYAVHATMPHFEPFEKKEAAAGKTLPKMQFLADEEGGEWDVEIPRPGKGTKRRKIFIDEVLERAQRARTRELPGHYPFVVQQSFIEGIVQEWFAPSAALCKEVHAILSDFVKKLVHKHFGTYGQGYLEQRVRAILQKHINECLDRAEARLKWLQELEDIPYTSNNHYLAQYRTKFLAHFKGARDEHAQQVLAQTLKLLAPAWSAGATASAQTPAPAPAPPAVAAPASAFGRSFGARSPSPSTESSPPPTPAAPTSTFGVATPRGFAFANNSSPFGKLATAGVVNPPADTPKFGTSSPAFSSVFGASKPKDPAPATASKPAVVPAASAPAPAAADAILNPPVLFPWSSQGSSAQTETLAKVLGGLAELGMPGVKPEDLPRLLPPDVMEPALVIMADVRAYFQVAFKRFVDNVPMTIDLELVRGVEKNILSVLYANLGINGPKGDAICKDLAQESRKIAEKRADLQKKLERLESARFELFTADF